jgi:hypothetical protein
MVLLAVVLPLFLVLFLSRRDFAVDHPPVPAEIADPASTPTAERP